MKTENKDGTCATDTLPRWQQISGITPEREASMTDDERDAGVRALLKEVQRLARQEITRGEKAPKGERTVYWEPLERVCRILGLSRTKLSSFSRELTGLRAHEITDRIKAETLPALMHARLEKELQPLRSLIERKAERSRAQDPAYILKWVRYCLRIVRTARSGSARGRFALELGFPNPSRLQKACLLAQGMSIDELEDLILTDMVQKFLKGIAEPARTSETKPAANKGQPKPPVMTPAEGEKLIDDAVKEVLRGKSSAA
ncbi:MAG TPA: hypothetical protein VEK08_14740 [Planctomycetota bacterium]|nr:hypothetical protein [Planctomycetota bacterium]